MLSQGPSGIHGTSAKMQRKAEEAARGRVFVRVSKQANQHVGVNMPEASQRAGLIRSCRRAEKQLFGAMSRRFNQGSRQCRQFGFGAPIVVEGDRRRCLGCNSTYQTPELVACLRLEMGSGTARGRRHRSSSAGCSLRAEEPPDWFAGREVGLAKISKRQPFKSTYGRSEKIAWRLSSSGQAVRRSAAFRSFGTTARLAFRSGSRSTGRRQSYRLRYPGVIVSTTISNSENVVAMVHEGSADLGLIEVAIDDPTLVIAPVAEDELILVAPLTHPWAARTPHRAQELKPGPWVLREPGSGTRSA